MAPCHVATLCSVIATLLATSSAQLGSADVAAANPMGFYDVNLAEEAVAKKEKDSITSVLQEIDGVVRKQLSDRNGQRYNAFSGFVVGLMLLVIDCRSVFKWFGVGCVALFATLLTMNEVEARWQIGYASGAAPIIAIEVGLAAGYMALRGEKGVMVLVGAGLGGFLAHLVRMLCSHLGFHGFQAEHQAANVVLYSLFVISSVVMIRLRQSAPLAYITPFLGGALVSAAVFWFMGWFSASGSVPPYANYVHSMCTGETDQALSISNNRIYGVVLWIVLFVVGALRQRMIAKNQEEKGYSN